MELLERSEYAGSMDEAESAPTAALPRDTRGTCASLAGSSRPWGAAARPSGLTLRSQGTTGVRATHPTGLMGVASPSAPRSLCELSATTGEGQGCGLTDRRGRLPCTCPRPSGLGERSLASGEALPQRGAWTTETLTVLGRACQDAGGMEPGSMEPLMATGPSTGAAQGDMARAMEGGRARATCNADRPGA